MSAPYYADPKLLLALNPNLASLTAVGQPPFADQVDAWDAIVRPQLEADLYSAFSAWPPPASSMGSGGGTDATDPTNDNVAKVLWLMLMTEKLQKSRFATNSTGAPSAFGADVKDEYDKLLEDVKAGRKMFAGAVRVESNPLESASRDRAWTIGVVGHPPTVQVRSRFPRGLRYGRNT